ncbi:pyrroloquinoline quinone biosynthesis peptide chaperone PqqD [Oecophyllibacter saccharovorans]|uniref:pyrroloquinoline quinone biosynthesis peptide chaperone PqqD n=1 Tax=Oecophyllibacter saccharovorans TaxID=2558360 RepID=UPI001169331B|nr:pyrroloquinoline quinone biosynthesis peptide chaperone PqqD [Oecophyllibacter saccharovorans]TPW35416.1 pyrroloquinoline quinone biosynthesis peptide chaperone PqqD [Oecophyllibacter saccharovorans]
MSAFTPASRPLFRRGVRLQHDRVRNRWLIQGPERAWLADETAATILQHLDGKHSINDIATLLASRYNAPTERILADILDLLAALKAKDLLREKPSD